MTHFVEAAVMPGVLLERWTYAPGPPGQTSRHAHAEYQLGVGLDMTGEYTYRGAAWPVPVGLLSVVHPGEPHFARDPEPRERSMRYVMMYLDERLVADAARALHGPGAGAPFFADPIVADPSLAAAFLALARACGGPEPAREEALTGFLERLVAARRPSSSPPRPAVSAGVLRAREMLLDRLDGAVPLAELAAEAGLSPFHLVRAFRARFGAPPHAYQLQARVDLAKRLLADGEPPSRAALRTGFYDQSHFGRHFLRVTGVTPARYRPANATAKSC